jgi:hypothetical protein
MKARPSPQKPVNFEEMSGSRKPTLRPVDCMRPQQNKDYKLVLQTNMTLLKSGYVDVSRSPTI